MHETSIVASLLNQLNELVQQHGGGQVREIRTEVGLLSGVEPVLLHQAFQQARIGTVADAAELVIAPVGLTCHCLNCQLNFVTDELRFHCPTCGNNRIEILAGDAVILQSFELATAVEAEFCS